MSLSTVIGNILFRFFLGGGGGDFGKTIKPLLLRLSLVKLEKKIKGIYLNKPFQTKLKTFERSSRSGYHLKKK